jgi:hypothetical protein
MRRRYLERHGLDGAWKLEGFESDVDADAERKAVVVIPALAEGDELFATLDSLAANSHAALRHLLVLVVVNQRCDATPDIRRQNQKDLVRLQEYAHQQRNLHLRWVDATAAHTCMPLKRGGVGMARKIGADLALPHLEAHTLIAHLDADTRVEPNYIATLTGYAHKDFYAGVVPFTHRPAANQPLQDAIDDYELYLRCHVAGLQWAGSPYAYFSMGSTMVSSAYAYVQCGGMNMRKAGEDFYFLQQLAKNGGVEDIRETCVYPSARISVRAPFGTGQNMHCALDTKEPLRLFYPLECYTLLRFWLELVSDAPESGGTDLLAELERKTPCGARFIRTAGFERIWETLQANHKDTRRRIKAFHEWFDALKSWQLIRTLGTEMGAPWMAREAIGGFLPLLDPNQVPLRYRGADSVR